MLMLNLDLKVCATMLGLVLFQFINFMFTVFCYNFPIAPDFVLLFWILHNIEQVHGDSYMMALLS